MAPVASSLVMKQSHVGWPENSDDYIDSQDGRLAPNSSTISEAEHVQFPVAALTNEPEAQSTPAPRLQRWNDPTAPVTAEVMGGHRALLQVFHEADEEFVAGGGEFRNPLAGSTQAR